MHAARSILKHVLSSGPLASTIASAASRWNRRRFLIICYHSVSVLDEHRWDPELYVTESRLHSRFQRLHALGASVLSLTEALERQRDDTLPRRAVVLTFDDGTADFRSHIVPILQEFGYPATVYVATERVGTSARHWPGYASYLFWRGGVESPERIEGFRRRWQSSPAEVQDKALSELAHELGVDEQPLREQRAFEMMSPSDIRALPRELVSVQLHTHSHSQPRVREDYLWSLEKNRSLLTEYSGTVPVHFCYPSGNYSPQFASWLSELGIRTAATCDSGSVGPHTDLLRLPRLIETMLTPEHVFDGWVQGSLGALVEWRRSFMRRSPRSPRSPAQSG